VTYLVCLDAVHEAYRDLEQARLKCRTATHVLATIRKALDQALDLAYEQQAFGLLDPLFTKEEAALATYEQEAAKLTEVEERWCALKVALAYERELMQEGPPSQKRLS
jgi:hypothetical protein